MSTPSVIRTISEITPLPSGKCVVELFNPDGTWSKVKVYKTLAAARGVCTRHANRWPGQVDITASYPDGEQRTYGRRGL